MDTMGPQGTTSNFKLTIHQKSPSAHCQATEEATHVLPVAAATAWLAHAAARTNLPAAICSSLYSSKRSWWATQHAAAKTSCCLSTGAAIWKTGNTHTDTHTHTHRHAHSPTHMHTHTHTGTHTCRHTHTHMLTYTHMHFCTPSPPHAQTREPKQARSGSARLFRSNRRSQACEHFQAGMGQPSQVSAISTLRPTLDSVTPAMPLHFAAAESAPEWPSWKAPILASPHGRASQQLRTWQRPVWLVSSVWLQLTATWAPTWQPAPSAAQQAPSLV